MPSSYSEIRTEPHLEIVALNRRAWRVCDRRIPASDARRLLGYIEKVGDKFELLRMLRPGRTDRFDSLAAALEACERESGD